MDFVPFGPIRPLRIHPLVIHDLDLLGHRRKRHRDGRTAHTRRLGALASVHA